MSSGRRIVICGGGAIGAAIAYFTSRGGARSTVIERHTVAGAASGKSGGFLALDWCRGSPLDGLARRSFELHAELSAELGDPWAPCRARFNRIAGAQGATARSLCGRQMTRGGTKASSPGDSRQGAGTAAAFMTVSTRSHARQDGKSVILRLFARACENKPALHPSECLGRYDICTSVAVARFQGVARHRATRTGTRGESENGR